MRTSFSQCKAVVSVRLRLDAVRGTQKIILTLWSTLRHLIVEIEKTNTFDHICINYLLCFMSAGPPKDVTHISVKNLFLGMVMNVTHHKTLTFAVVKYGKNGISSLISRRKSNEETSKLSLKGRYTPKEGSANPRLSRNVTVASSKGIPCHPVRSFTMNGLKNFLP